MYAHLRHTAFVIAGIVLSGTLPALAQSPSRADERCPEGYWLLDAICVNKATGDRVNATPAAAAIMSDEHGCAPGYWRLEQVCISRVTGDVELVEEQQMPKRETSASRRW
jgi:hypothetical protein